MSASIIYKLGINDNKFWRKDLLIMHLYSCLINNQTTVLNVTPEGSSLEGCGVYQHLDTFCDTTGYAKENISIRTGNMVEEHPHYRIIKDPTAWYEVPIIQSWIKTNTVNVEFAPTKHFGHFIGKSNWNRLWMAAILHSKYSNKTFQTFNSGIGTHYLTKNDGLSDFVGLEDLVKNDCVLLEEAIAFLRTCPRFIPEDIEFIKTCAVNIKQQDHFPIQLPANLNILKYYNDIFVDIVHETFVRDRVCFATEKTWRPMLARRPFITMGGVGHLANLRKLGFRTFNDYWDEGYDDCGMNHRINAMALVIEKISQLPPEKLTQLLHDMKPILEHNYNVFMSMTHMKIKKAFDA